MLWLPAAASSVPVQTEFLALKGLERMIKTFENHANSSQLPFHYTIVPTMFDKRTRASLQSLETVRELYGSSVWDSVIPIDTKFRDASHLHVPHSHLCPEVEVAMPILNCSII